MIFFVLAGLMIAAIVLAAKGMKKAYQKSIVLLEVYKDVFNQKYVTRMSSQILMGILWIISCIGYTIASIILGEASLGSIALFVLVGIVGVVFFIWPYFSIKKRYTKCPDYLKNNFYKDFRTCCIGFFGWVCKISWNMMFSVWSVIPGFGFMAGFIIEDDKQKKEELIKAGEQADKEYWEQQNRKRQEEEERQREEEERIAEKKRDIRREAWKKDGRTDVEFNRDFTRHKYSDESWDDSRPVD